MAKQKNLNSMQQKMKMKYEAAKNEAQKVVIKEGSNVFDPDSQEGEEQVQNQQQQVETASTSYQPEAEVQ